jgi:hypothetical protein
MIDSCWYGLALSPALEAEITRRWPGRAGSDQVFCVEPGGHDRPHRACVAGLPVGAVWVEWSSTASPRLLVLADCPSAGPDGAYGCSLYDDHGSPHTWERDR